MAKNKRNIPNVMPDAMIEPITDMELINAKLKHEGKQNKKSEKNTAFHNIDKEV